jgi:hypothetical protein
LRLRGRRFERHPALEVVCVEADAGWAPHFACRMDHGYTRHRFGLTTVDMARPCIESTEGESAGGKATSSARLSRVLRRCRAKRAQAFIFPARLA